MKKPVVKAAEMPDFVSPCLASLAAAPPEGPLWGHEIKFDGYRLQARIDSGDVRLFTRSGLDWTGKFARIKDALAALQIGSAIIDGEVVVEDSRGVSVFADLVSDIKSRRSERMVFLAFDLLFSNGDDIRGRPLHERKQLLKRVLTRRTTLEQLRYCDHIEGNGGRMFDEVCKLGLEGMISKRLDKPYRSGRGADWLKIKCLQRDDFVIAGYLDSTAVSKGIGALVLGYYVGQRLIYAGRVGTGFSRRTAVDLWQQLQPLARSTSPFANPLDAAQAKAVMWVTPKLVAEVAYGSWTGDGVLRHATFKTLRDDKAARHVGRPTA